MKLTESRIKQIILEELEQAQQDQDQEQKMQPDVELMLKNIERIDNSKEYSELIQAIMRYAPKSVSDSQKITVLRNVRDLINVLLKGGK